MKNVLLIFVWPHNWNGTKIEYIQDYFLEDCLLEEIFNKPKCYLKPIYWYHKIFGKIFAKKQNLLDVADETN